MFKSLYRKLALSSLRRHKNLFIPFIGTGIFLMVLTGLSMSLWKEESFQGQYGMEQMGLLLKMAVYILLFFSFLSLSSVYSFIQKRKLKESGLLLSLGLDKSHLRRILTWEMAYLALMIGLPAFFLAALLHKLSFGLYIRITGLDIDPFSTGIMPNLGPLALVFLAYMAIFALLLLVEMFRTRKFTAIGLINEARAGEKPGALPLWKAIVGVLALAGGYSISLFTQDPIQSISLFFPAVILVIIGTYLAFSVIISWFLSFLKSKKTFYYKKENFAAISGLIYRIRNSSRSLANICILSTSVMVIFTAGFSLYIGAEERVREAIPSDYMLVLNPKKEDTSQRVQEIIEDQLEGQGLKGQVQAFKNLDFPVKEEGGRLLPIGGDYNFKNIKNIRGIKLIYAPEAKIDFKDKDYVWIRDGRPGKDLSLVNNTPYGLIEAKDSYLDLPQGFSIYPIYNIYVRDIEALETLSALYKIDQETSSTYFIQRQEEGEAWRDFAYNLRENLNGQLTQDKEYVQVRDRDVEIKESKAMFGAIFYVMILLGTAFLLSTGLAIYYKQLTEGYDDRDRFRIMGQVGMTGQEARKTIQKQIQMVFILPLAFSLIHTFFAYPILKRILVLLSMGKDWVFVLSLVCVFTAFALFYFVFYKLTEGVYRKLVLP